MINNIFCNLFFSIKKTMATNGHAPLVKQDSKSAAIVEVNSLSEDNQLVNPADHDGRGIRYFVFILICYFALI